MSNKLVIWDFDGVIADTFDMCLNIIRLSNPELTKTEYRQRFEGNINKIKKDRRERSHIDFWAEYEKNILNQKMTEGIENPVQYFAEFYPSVIVSSTISKPINQFLEHHTIRQYFQEIFGNEISESKIEKFNMILKKYNIRSEDCVLITDTLGDMKEASKAGIKSVGVTWGYQSRETLEKGNPASIVEKPEEIIAAANEIL
ncbi:MAG TPA: HAD family hydrolase [Candidatus Andersenbacteria bacterium]|nr:HAD family hydrolase [Candidatus Andersenbacteria bacterium]